MVQLSEEKEHVYEAAAKSVSDYFECYLAMLYSESGNMHEYGETACGGGF